ncbi:hypothetical protein BJF78_06685 [Pseudonocardia sp. CNS-139]|nr:hypothetical protein BJF78_06685 [Pseudonocardia sp. CNS-139]
MQRMVGAPGGDGVVGALVVGQRSPDHGDVGRGAAGRRGAGDERLDEAPGVGQLRQLVEARHERAPERALGERAPAVLHDGPAVAPAARDDVPGVAQPGERLAQGLPADAEQRRQLPFRGEPLAGREVADGDRGDEPVGDRVDAAAHADRAELRPLLAPGTRPVHVPPAAVPPAAPWCWVRARRMQPAGLSRSTPHDRPVTSPLSVLRRWFTQRYLSEYQLTPTIGW